MPTPEELHTQIQYRLVEQLAESEVRYRQLLANLTEIVFEIDHMGCLQFLNPAWKKVLGYCDQTSLQKSFQDFLVADHENAALDIIHKLRQTPVQQELQLYHANGHVIWMELLSQPTQTGGAAGTLTDITTRKEALAQLQYQAEHDVLTGVINRTTFMAALEARLAAFETQNVDFAVLFLDLDRFKVINDSYGHMMGDLLLKDVSQRLKRCVRSGDLIARFGGDEFNILLHTIQSRDEVVTLVNRIQETLRQPFILQGHEIICDSSLGIWCSDQNTVNEDPVTSQTILRYADTALYLAKMRGRGSFSVFTNSMQVKLQERLDLEKALRRAIDERSLEVYYQPIVSLKDSRTIGFEALLRWQHPSKGWISPSKFIPIAEESGLITPLGWFVFEEVCRQRAIWQQKFPRQSERFISVNFSSRQFLQSNIATKIHSILNQFAVQPHQIKLEITETSLMEDVDLASQNLNQLDQIGINISIDDFGTGYSSLSYLHQFPISTLKIDRSFLTGQGEAHKLAAIVDTIINLAHKLGMAVIAEGVEIGSQALALKALGCEMGQGYFWGKPQPADAISMIEQECWHTNLSPLSQEVMMQYTASQDSVF